MSQFPSVPPPGTYAPPNQMQSIPPAQGFNPQQQPHYGHQQQQSPPPYGAPAPTYGPPASSHNKPTNAFGQAFNQAMTTGKPMLNKLGKTISSKLGSKPAQSTPQHLESYQNYQQHQQQQFNSTPQQSPFPQPTYGSPASGNSGQSNYFPQQTPQTPNPQAPHQQTNAIPSYSANVFGQGGNVGGLAQAQPTYGQVDQGQSQASPSQAQLNQTQPQGPPQQPQSDQYSGQQTGVVGDSQTQPQNTNQPGSQQQQWAPSPPQQPQSFNPTPPPQQFNAAPSLQQYNTAPPVPVHPNQQQQQQWTATSPVSPQLESFQPIPPVTPPQFNNQQQPTAIAPPEPRQQHQPPTPASQKVAPQTSPTEFVAELPADLSNMSIVENSKPDRPPSDSAAPGSTYQAYRPAGAQSTSPRPGFTVARRAVSTSNLPLADPWRFADPATELPTREFFIIADLIFDTLDRKFEPQNTGLIEASKMLESWKVQDFAEEAARLFMHDSYIAFAKLWSIEGIPHLMVPCEPALTPIWNFQQHSHSHELKIPMGSALENPIKPTYIPALNRAGFYKYFFLCMMQEPEGLEKMLTAFCADTYKPGVLNQPNVQRRDRTPLPGLAAQATAIQSAAISCVCQEMAAMVQGAHAQHDAGAGQTQSNGGAAQGQPGGGMTQEEMMLKLHSLKMQQQTNNMMNQTMINGAIGISTAAGNSYTNRPNYGGFV